MPARAAFLDRDGTIIYDRGPAKRPGDVELIPGVKPVLENLMRRGYLLVVVTNQAGMSRGEYTFTDFCSVNGRMLDLLGRKEVRIVRTYFCPHGQYDGCACRKPKPGMFLDAKRDLNLDLSKSIMIGDKESDHPMGIPGLHFIKVIANSPWPTID